MNNGFGQSHLRLSNSLQYTRHVLVWLLIGSFAAAVHADSSAPDRLTSDAFAKGSRNWSVTTGASYDAGLASVYSTQINVSQYIADDVAVEYGAIFGYIDARRTTEGVFAGPELGMRWHFAKHERWSTYLEGAVGAVYQQHPFTDRTLRFNFDLQPGGGATYRFSHNTLVQGGFRWHHLSNAQVRGRAHNFGYDGPMLYIGLTKPF